MGAVGITLSYAQDQFPNGDSLPVLSSTAQESAFLNSSVLSQTFNIVSPDDERLKLIWRISTDVAIWIKFSQEEVFSADEGDTYLLQPGHDYWAAKPGERCAIMEA